MTPKVKIKKIIFLILIIFIISIIILGILNTRETDTNILSIKKRIGRAIRNESYSHESVTYYVSANGTSTDGTDINDPMSLEIANLKVYNGNDRILLKSGDTFYGQINFQIDTCDEDMAYIGSYGEGEKPILSAAKIVNSANSWEKYSEYVYRVDLKNYEKFSGLKKNDLNSCDVGFWEDSDGNIYGKKKNLLANLRNEGDFYCDGRYFYVKSETVPYDKYGEIKLATKLEMLRMGSKCVIENIHIEYTGAHGIVKKYTYIKDVEIKNCIIEKIGGSYLYGIGNENIARYGNGIEFWNQAENTNVNNCVFYEIFDAAYTLQGNGVINGFKDNICENNIFINCSYNTEFFSNNPDDSGNSNMENTIIRNNISINQDRGWGYICRTSETIYLGGNVVISRITDKSSISYYNNISINSLRLYFKRAMVEDETFKKVFTSYENLNILGDDTIILGDDNGEIIKKKDQLQNNENLDNGSYFANIPKEQLTEVYNKETISGLNYEKISTYFKKFATNIKERSLLSEIYECYNNVDKEIQTSQIKNEIDNANKLITKIIKKKDTMDISELNELYNKDMDIINLSIINNETAILNEIENTFEKYSILYKCYLTENDTVDENDTKNRLNDIIEKYNNNVDIDIADTANLINTLKDVYEKMMKADILVDKYLYNKRIIRTCEIVDKMLDNDIRKAADEDSNNVTITYNVDVNTLTNQDVYVTINLPTDKAIIVNNEQNAPYIFKENGTKTITINIRGYEYTYNISVKNIDKTAPKIDNVEQLNNSVTPQISDDNLQNVELKLDGNLKLEYQVGQTITTPGMYSLTAKDKSGNVTITNFIIYDIYNENNQKINYIPIYNVTTLKNLKNNINMKYTITKNNQEINENDYISAGCEIQINNKQYYLIVKGDINGDGKVTGTDLVKVRRYLIGLETFTPVEKVGAILSQRNDVSINDLAKMRKIILQ